MRMNQYRTQNPNVLRIKATIGMASEPDCDPEA